MQGTVSGDAAPVDPRRTRGLRDTEQHSAELAQRLSLSAYPVDFRPHRRHQRRVRCVLAKGTEFMFEVLLGLRRDIAHSSFPLEFDDKLPGCVHPATIEQSAAVEEGILDKPELHRFGVPAHCGCAIPHQEDTETGQTDFVALLQMACRQRHQIARHGLSLLLCDLMAVGQSSGEVLEGDRRLRFGWGCLLCWRCSG
jgi:hypothetical protein